jgi:hypothetical protein
MKMRAKRSSETQAAYRRVAIGRLATGAVGLGAMRWVRPHSGL